MISNNAKAAHNSIMQNEWDFLVEGSEKETQKEIKKKKREENKI